MEAKVRQDADLTNIRQLVTEAFASETSLDDAFALMIQPIVDLSGNHSSHHELLLRMRMPGGELISPADFSPAVRQLGYEEPLDQWVAARAVLMLAPGEDRGPQLEINLSRKTMVNKGFCDQLSGVLDRRGVSPGALIVEVEEGGSVAPGEVGQFARRRFSLAHHFSAIDFEGHGYDEMNRLSSLPYDFIKIDGDFIRELPANPGDQGIVRRLAKMVSRAGRRSVALHVEDDETVRLLREAEVDFGQGYHFGRPELLTDLRPPNGTG
jgi:EAL domain-containing protein (putative c-di-GMP-specific phosphodiesterase class I)